MSILSVIDKAAIKAANTDDLTWRPYYYASMKNGILVRGCSTTKYVRGPRKGEIKFLLKQNSITVVLTREMIEKE